MEGKQNTDRVGDVTASTISGYHELEELLVTFLL